MPEGSKLNILGFSFHWVNIDWQAIFPIQRNVKRVYRFHKGSEDNITLTTFSVKGYNNNLISTPTIIIWFLLCHAGVIVRNGRAIGLNRVEFGLAVLEKAYIFVWGFSLFCWLGFVFNAAGRGEADALFRPARSCGMSSAGHWHKQVTSWVETSQGKVLMFLAQHHVAANTWCLCGTTVFPLVLRCCGSLWKCTVPLWAGQMDPDTCPPCPEVFIVCFAQLLL